MKLMIVIISINLIWIDRLHTSKVTLLFWEWEVSISELCSNLDNRILDSTSESIAQKLRWFLKLTLISNILKQTSFDSSKLMEFQRSTLIALFSICILILSTSLSIAFNSFFASWFMLITSWLRDLFKYVQITLKSSLLNKMFSQYF